MVSHPAQFSEHIIDQIHQRLDPRKQRRILDPFAGTGGIHELRRWGHNTVGVEIEPKWARWHPLTETGDATDLKWRARSFDAIVTSPAYGNRLADAYVPKKMDTSTRLSYRISLGQDLKAGNAGGMHFGDDYKELHRKAWSEAERVLRRGGLFILNCKNFYKAGVEQLVCEWHTEALVDLGLVVLADDEITAPNRGFTFSPNRQRLPERLITLEKPE
ncbi:MAG: hypothetical protein HKN01_01375 [Acidimicrobiia bacterium]|nr:hypothetical protein [Acidimicrobiia bacterium]